MTSTQARRVAALGMVALLAVGGLGVAAQPAAAEISEYSISVGADVAQANSLVPVTVTGLYSATTCRLSAVGPKRGKVVIVKVKEYEAKGRVRVPAGAPGQYRIKAACGKDGTALSGPFRVVAVGNPTSASCDVLESGFSVNAAKTSASFGAVLGNRSPDLAAVDIELALTWRDPAGNVVKTSSLSAEDIPPRGTVFVASSGESAANAASVAVATLCETGEPSPLAPILGTGTTRRDFDNELIATGQFVNTTGTTIGTSSKVVILFRDGAGSIIGGDVDYVDAFTLPGGVATWTSYSGYYFPSMTPVVQSMLFPRQRD